MNRLVLPGAFPRSLVVLLCVVLASEARADVVGSEDFDGGGNATNFITAPADPGLNALFSQANRFDRWGVGNRTVTDSVMDVTVESFPFDLVDETIAAAAGSDTGVPFTNDDFGIFKSTETSNAFVVGDLENDLNLSGLGIAQWTFDISGFTNLNLAIDMAAVGVFESDDSFVFSVNIDGGGDVPVISGSGNEGTFYSVTMENGVTYDRYVDTFWALNNNDAVWNFMIANPGLVPFVNGGSTIDWCTCDADEDGFDDVSGEKALQDTNSFGSFEEQERVLFEGPLSFNGTDLDNDFQTISAPIVGTGDELVLRLTASQFGSIEYYAFDNIVITGDEASGQAGDFDGDGDVDVADALEGQRTDQPLGAGSDWNTNFGVGSLPASAVSSVPEPTSTVLIGLGAILLGSRRWSA